MSSIVKRCTAAAVLALAMLLPQFSSLQTSSAGLRLIADFEGCQLSPLSVQCRGVDIRHRPHRRRGTGQGHQ